MVIYSSKMVTQPSRIMLNLLENPWKILLHWSHIDHTPNFSDCFALKRPRFFRQSFKSWFLMVLACFHSYSFAKPCQSPENSWFSKVFHAQFQGLTDIDRNLPSGKQSQKTMENQKITMFYGRFSTISMAIFNSYVSLPEGKPPFSYGFPMVFLWFSYGSHIFHMVKSLESPEGKTGEVLAPPCRHGTTKSSSSLDWSSNMAS